MAMTHTETETFVIRHNVPIPAKRLKRPAITCALAECGPGDCFDVPLKTGDKKEKARIRAQVYKQARDLGVRAVTRIVGSNGHSVIRVWCVAA